MKPRNLPFVSISVLLFILSTLAALVGCNEGDKKRASEDRFDTLSISIADAPENTYKDETKEVFVRPGPAPAPGPAEPTPSKLYPHLGGTVILQPADGEYAASLEFLMEKLENGAPQSASIKIKRLAVGHFDVQDVEATYYNGYEFFSAGEAWPDAPVNVDITAFDTLTGRVQGSFEMMLCYVEASYANTCGLEDNQLSIKGSFDITLAVIDALPGPFHAEGSAEQPVDLGESPLKRPERNQSHIVDATASYYRIGVVPGNDHEFRLASYSIDSVQRDVEAFVYADAAFTDELCHIGVKSGSDNVCNIASAPVVLYVKVVYAGETEARYAGAIFGLFFTGVTPYLAESTDGSPVDLGDQIPLVHPGSAEGTNSYRVTVTPGTNYTVSLVQPSTWQLRMEVRNGPTASSWHPAECQTLFEILSCSIPALSDELLIEVFDQSDSLNGVAYTLTVEEGGDGHSKEGDVENPLALGGEYPIDHPGHVNADISHYLIDTIPGETYTLRLNDTDTFLAVYLNTADATDNPIQRCYLQKPVSNCPFVARTDKTDILVAGNYTASGTDYRLVITHGGTAHPAEGSWYSPLPLTPTLPLLHAGSVSGISSYYTITLDPDKTYTFSTTKATTPVRLYVEDSTTLSGPRCRAGFVTRQQQQCVIGSNGNPFTVHVVADYMHDGTADGTFELHIEEGGTPFTHEGSWSAPVDLSGALTIEHRGSVDDNPSDYRVNVEPDTHYTVHVTNLSAAVSVAVTQGRESCSDSPDSIRDRTCTITTDDSGDPIIIQIDASFSLSGATYTLGITSP